jgi:hypothetical protein
MIRHLALGLALALSVVGCSSSEDSGKSAKDKGGDTDDEGGGKKGGSKKGGGEDKGGSHSSTQTQSCCINGSHYDCATEAAANKCFSDGDASGCKFVKRTDSCSSDTGGGSGEEED